MKTILGTLMRLAIVTVAPAAIGMSAWSTASLAEPAENVAPAVTVARATTSDIALRTMVAGTIVPRDLVEVNPQINGAAILDIHVEAGDTVAKGAVLARLDDTLFKAQKVKALAGIERARASIAEARSQIDSAQAAF